MNLGLAGFAAETRRRGGSAGGVVGGGVEFPRNRVQRAGVVASGFLCAAFLFYGLRGWWLDPAW